MSDRGGGDGTAGSEVRCKGGGWRLVGVALPFAPFSASYRNEGQTPLSLPVREALSGEKRAVRRAWERKGGRGSPDRRKAPDQ